MSCPRRQRRPKMTSHGASRVAWHLESEMLRRDVELCSPVKRKVGRPHLLVILTSIRKLGTARCAQNGPAARVSNFRNCTRIVLTLRPQLTPRLAATRPELTSDALCTNTVRTVYGEPSVPCFGTLVFFHPDDVSFKSSYSLYLHTRTNNIHTFAVCA